MTSTRKPGQPGIPAPLARRGIALIAAGALASGALVAATGSTVQADEVPPGTRDLSFAVQQATTNPGQYQIAASEETDELFVTSAAGRPPVLIATLTKIDPVTLEVIDKADLPVIPHGTEGAQFKRLSTHGIDVDDSTDTVWVTNTRDNQVSVYDRDTLDLVWTSYDFEGPVTQVEIQHPREVYVDEQRGKAYVTAANRGGATDASVTVYDTTTFEVVEEIAIPARANYPSDGVDTYAVPMGLEIDEEGGRVFANDFNTDEYYIIDADDYSFTRHPIPNPLLADGTLNAGRLQPSSVAVNLELNELYSANQSGSEGQGSLDVFDLATNELKYSIATGPRALAVAADEDNDLIYVADFTNGTVTVVDALTEEVVDTLETDRNVEDDIAARGNHIEVLNGSAYMVDKSGDQPVSVDYAVDLNTGEIVTVDANADSITKITPNADVAVAEVGYVGGTLRIDGAFLRNKLGDVGSKIGVKIEDYDPEAPTAPGASYDHVEGSTVHPNATIWAVLDADETGHLSLEMPLPDGSTEGAQGSVRALEPGTYGLRMLTGSLLQPPGSDVVRSLKIPFEVKAALAAVTAPSVSGKAVVGRKVTAAPGTWNHEDAVVSFQWLRNGNPIGGATKQRYAVQPADAGKRLSVRATATLDGAAPAEATSDATKAGKGTLSVAKKPTIKGKAKAGKQLKVTKGSWAPGKVSLRYRWLRNGDPIAGAHNKRYAVRAADKGTKLRVLVTATKAGYQAKAVKTKARAVKK